jgi:hypothetical protein
VIDRLLHYRKLTRLLDEALAIEQHRLPPHQVETVREYIDHDEYGLALEQLADALCDLALRLSAKARIPMDAAAALMGIEYESRLMPE